MVHYFEKCTLLVLLLLFFSVVLHGRNTLLEQLHALTTSSVDSQQISSLIAISDYYNYRNSDSSLWYAQEAAELAANSENQDLRFFAQIRLGSSYFHNGDFLLAHQYFQSATDLGYSIHNEELAAEGMMYTGIIYAEMGEIDSANIFLTKALEIAHRERNYLLAARILNSSGELYRLMNEGSKAVEAYQLSLSFFQQLGYPSEFFVAKKNWATAINPTEPLNHLIQNHQKELSDAKSQLIQQSKTIVFSNQMLLFICLLGILISGIFYLQYTNQVHLNDKLKLIHNELKTQQIQQNHEYKQKLLVIKSRNLAERKQLIDELKKRVNQPKKRPNATQAVFIEQLTNFSKKNAQEKWDWKSFQSQFDSLYKGYSTSLKIQCPTLTPREVKICALMKIKLSDTEMASILGLSGRNFQKAKEKLEKKIVNPSVELAYN